MRRPATSVLFLQPGNRLEADGQVHATIMRRLPALGFSVYAASAKVADGQPSATFVALDAIPEVRLVSVSFGPERSGGGWRALVHAAAGSVRAGAGLASLARLVRRERIDVVHCTEKAREALFGYLIARATGAALVMHLHIKVGSWFPAPTRWVMHRATRLVAISEYVAQTAIDSGYRPDLVRVALNALEPVGLPVGDRGDDQASVRLELGIADTTAIISIVARMTPWKGHEALLEAVRDVAGTRDVAVLVVGGNEPEATQLRTLAAELGLGAQTHFLGHRTDTVRLIRASDIYAMPSYEEPFGLVYLEAMWAGVPVVGLDNGGTPEVVVDDVTGLLSPPGDGVALTTNIARLLDDPDLCARLGAAGRQRVAEHFGADRLAADMARIYTEIAVGRAHQAAAR